MYLFSSLKAWHISGAVLLFLFVLLMMLVPMAEALENTTPGNQIRVNSGDNITFLCTYDGIDPDDTFKVRFTRYERSKYNNLWVYEGNSTHATSDGPTPGYTHLNMERVNKGSEQFNMSLQFFSVTVDDNNKYYRCFIQKWNWGPYWHPAKPSTDIDIIVESGKLS